MDITYVCIIIRGAIKKIKIKFIQGGQPSHKAKTMRNEQKLTQTVNLHIKRKSVPPMDITYVCIIIEGTLKKLNLNLSSADGPRTEQKL